MTGFRHRRNWSVALSIIVLGGVVWLLRPSSAPPELVHPSTDPSEPAPVRVSLPEPQTTPAQFTLEGVPIRPADSTPVDARGMVPHPITPQHLRIFRENNLIGDLNGAMDVKDAAGLRALLKQYREEFPEDAHVLQDGYALIADCLERLGPQTRAAAQRYYDEQLDSGLRRYIRRHCLETTP